MGDEKNRALEITATGWSVLDRYSVTFWKPSTQAAIPEPVSGGSINELMETFMRFALKAQNQCRSTLDTLAQIKHPRQTVITKQANISNGHQQVNNTLHQGGEQQLLNLKNSEIEQNKLLKHEQEKGERLDSGKTGEAGGSDPAVAAVDKVNRGKNRGREGESGAEC